MTQEAVSIVVLLAEHSFPDCKEARFAALFERFVETTIGFEHAGDAAVAGGEAVCVAEETSAEAFCSTYMDTCSMYDSFSGDMAMRIMVYEAAEMGEAVTARPAVTITSEPRPVTQCCTAPRSWLCRRDLCQTLAPGSAYCLPRVNCLLLPTVIRHCTTVYLSLRRPDNRKANVTKHLIFYSSLFRDLGHDLGLYRARCREAGSFLGPATLASGCFTCAVEGVTT